MDSMSAIPADSERALRIAHVFRAPLGGLFRHVVDLAAEQAARGHQVGMFFDSGGACPRVERALQRIPGGLGLGVGTTPIGRNPGFSDIVAFTRFGRWLRAVSPDIVHGHGSKGGALARISRLAGVVPAAARVYTPHGGSFNTRPRGLAHGIYMSVERALAPLTDSFLFESAYVAGRFAACAGGAPAFGRVIVNGLGPEDFGRIDPWPEAAEFLYIGELRAAKGLAANADHSSGARTRLPLRTLGSRRGSTRRFVLRAIPVASVPHSAHARTVARHRRRRFSGLRLFRSAPQSRQSAPRCSCICAWRLR